MSAPPPDPKHEPIPRHIVAYTDGGARGNPGPAGYGLFVVDAASGETVHASSGAIGRATNNVAEYEGLLAALRFALDHDCRRVTIRSDSELLVRQMLGEYRVRNAGLKALHDEARRLVSRLERVDFTHVRRAENREADRLANEAMDRADAETRAEG